MFCRLDPAWHMAWSCTGTRLHAVMSVGDGRFSALIQPSLQ
uniref:Uncharacterized protein n=1 Tax=Arundo donax TaxID=35708 RepID=A0A0A8Z2U0_ARUDO